MFPGKVPLIPVFFNATFITKDTKNKELNLLG